MIDQLKVLLRVKEVKEQQALRALNAKRRQLAEAKLAVETARAQMRASAATLSAREDAIYHTIMSHVVGLDEIEETKGRVQQLEAEHGKLVDAVERAIHVRDRLEKELADLIEVYRKTVKDRDKYVVLTNELAAELNAKAAERDEIEVEDLFGSRRRRSA